MTKLSKAQMDTLVTLIVNGHKMNGFAGQPGFSVRSIPTLTRLGLVEEVPNCANCDPFRNDTNNKECLRPLAGQKGGNLCYRRVRITWAGVQATWID